MDPADREAGRKVGCPLLVIWGAKSHTGRVYGDVLKIWRDYGTTVTGGPIENGHHVPQEAPDATHHKLLAFLRLPFGAVAVHQLRDAGGLQDRPGVAAARR